MTVDPTDTARKAVVAAFAAAGRHDFREYIETRLAGDFAAALADLVVGNPEPTTKQALTIAQRAIDDLRRYSFDNTAERRQKRAQLCQESLDALSRTVGVESNHRWPRDPWISDEAAASLATIDREAASLISRVDLALDDTLPLSATDAMQAAKAFALFAVEDAHDQRRALSHIERELQAEEYESDHWARKATLDGDLGANPPIFLVDVVEDLNKRIAELEAERDEQSRMREKLRIAYNTLQERVMELEARI